MTHKLGLLLALTLLQPLKHQRELVVKKADSIETFLQRCRQQLRADFVEMKSVAVDQMMFIKADTIIPHQYTFYDLILTKGTFRIIHSVNT